MGTWDTGITGNDTARDLYTEYSAAFYKYDVEEAVQKIDHYIRTEMFDETDQEEWCNYIYSLADFMWKKGILTEAVRDHAIGMIDSGFGLDLWAEAGQKTLNARNKKLAEFREKLLSPQPPRKKIKPKIYPDRIFEDGDIIAIQLQTAGKPYAESQQRPMSEEDFHALDGKYVILQLGCCFASWTSRIAPEVKDYYACFRLFDGIYDELPQHIDASQLKEARIYVGSRLSSSFSCESSMFYFKRRNYRLLGNRKDLLTNFMPNEYGFIFFSINTPWSNPDSQIVASIGKQIQCHEFTGTMQQVYHLCQLANRYGRYTYNLSQEENANRFAREEATIRRNIDDALARGARVYSLSFGRELGIITIENKRIDNLYIEGQFQRNGFGTHLLQFAFSLAGKGAYMDVPASHSALLRICRKIGLQKIDSKQAAWLRVCEKIGLISKSADSDAIRMVKP